MPTVLGGLGAGLGGTWGPSHTAFVCRHGGPILEAREGAAGDPPEAAEEGGKYWSLRPWAWWERAVPLSALSAQTAERWLPRAEEEGLWPVEEDRLEDSLEDLGVAGGHLLGGPGRGSAPAASADLPSAGVLPSHR